MYDAHYYAYYKPVPYAWDQFYWLRFFGNIAYCIAKTLQPQTALDVGCGVGFLVGALRAQGVDAGGLDVSGYAIAQVPEWLKKHCWVGGALQPFPQQYDLLTCIEVAEHLPEEQAAALVTNLCQHTGQVLFSSTPADTDEPTHQNVQLPEYWQALFLENGFVWRSDYNATYISPQARLYAHI